MTYDRPTQGDKFVFTYHPDSIDFALNDKRICTFSRTILKYVLKAHKKWKRNFSS